MPLLFLTKFIPIKSWRAWMVLGVVIGGLALYTYIQSLQKDALQWEGKYHQTVAANKEAEIIWTNNQAGLTAAIEKQNNSTEQLATKLTFAEEAIRLSAINLNHITTGYENRILGLNAVPVPQSCNASFEYLAAGIKDIQWLDQQQ